MRSALGSAPLLLALLTTVAPQAARAETLTGALSRAYVANPQLNAQRAQVRATDETVPEARAGLRPRVQLDTSAGVEFTRERERASGAGGESGSSQSGSTLLTRETELTLDQTLFDGFRTQNRVRQAESQVLGQRETLRNTEQNVLLDAVTAYMDVLRDIALLQLQRSNADVLSEQLLQVRERLTAGQITGTDVAQAQARLASARAQVNLAEANLRASTARYRRIVGLEPRALAPGQPVSEKLLPANLPAAVKVALAEHPAVKAALHGVDAAELEVRIVTGELLPAVGLSGSFSRRFDVETRGDSLSGAGAATQVVVPIYEGGETYARARQAKETAGQQRSEAEVTRDEVRAAVAAAWGALQAARDQVTAAQAQIEAGETALTGVREEAAVGQRTTLDVLNAQQELLNARVNLTVAQRDRVVASYALLASTGRLSARVLGLKVPVYSPKPHFDQVKDLWGGLRTPDGR